MRKTLSILMTAAILAGCSVRVITNLQTDDPYVVTDIYIVRMFGKSVCGYNLSTGSDHLYYADDICIIEEPGKFSIGDTVILTASKPAGPVEKTVMDIIRELTK